MQSLAFVLMAGAVLAAGAASAEPIAQLSADVPAAKILIRLPQAGPMASDDPLALAVRAKDSMPTAVDRSFGDKMVGALGFLCGRQSGQTDSGSAAAFGSDPHGRFVGAKLSLAF